MTDGLADYPVEGKSYTFLSTSEGIRPLLLIFMTDVFVYIKKLCERGSRSTVLPNTTKRKTVTSDLRSLTAMHFIICILICGLNKMHQLRNVRKVLSSVLEYFFNLTL